MLYADKAALENRTKLRLLAIRERELTLYTQNCFTIGTVSALMAGLAYSSLLYTKMDYFQDASAFVQAMYVLCNVVSMYLALRAMTGTTMIAMFGPGKVRACVPSALRGAPGSVSAPLATLRACAPSALRGACPASALRAAAGHERRALLCVPSVLPARRAAPPAPPDPLTQKRRTGRRCAAPMVRCTRRWTACSRSSRRRAHILLGLLPILRTQTL